MSIYEMVVTYLTAMFGRFRDDEDGGGAAEYIVIVGISVLAAAVIGGIIWTKLRNGANDVDVPTPAAP